MKDYIKSSHEKIADALFYYLKSNEFRDRFYYALVYEHKPFNQYHLYMFELEDSPEEKPSDLIIIYAIDYDEGQEIDVLRIYSQEDIFHSLLFDYQVMKEGVKKHEQTTGKKEKKETSSES